MKILVLTGLFSLTSSLFTAASESSLNTSAIQTVSLIKTFRGISARDYDYIPPYAIEGETTTVRIRERKCSSKKPNDSTLTEVNNTTLEYLTSSLSTKLIPAVYLSAVLLGVPSNAIILWMLLFRIRSVCTAILYTNLAVSDLLFCIMLPFKIAYHLNGNNWIFGEMMCRTTTAVFYGNMYCSILLLTCISVSRYVAIVHPFTYKSLPKRTYATAVCATVWTIVFLYMLPLCIMKQSYYVKQLGIFTCHDVHNACETVSAFQFYYYISLAIFGFLIPLVTIIFCYIAIIQTLKTHEWFWYVKGLYSFAEVPYLRIPTKSRANTALDDENEEPESLQLPRAVNLLPHADALPSKYLPLGSLTSLALETCSSTLSALARL
ncbi:proteinase-activated receptor 3 isoform X2 [Struthio camelus]|uniref:proteinase-activated receptor 3 isoform X2 n=1 Tax=Struthio camelus TaxID=8801 RepID=UPI00360413C3